MGGGGSAGVGRLWSGWARAEEDRPASGGCGAVGLGRRRTGWERQGRDAARAGV
jgi:hypothetical protein